MKTPRIVSLLAALSFTTAAFSQSPGPDPDQPPGPPPQPRVKEGPPERGEPGPGPRHDHGSHRNPQQRPGDSSEKREHIEEALKHLRAAGLGHMAERIQQALKDNPQGPQDQQNRRDFRRSPRNLDRRREAPWQSHAGPRRFHHPHLPYGPGFGSGSGRDGQPGPFARPNFQARGERPRHGFEAQRPARPGDPGTPGDADLRAEVQQLKRAVEELRRSLPNRDNRDNRADGPGPDRHRRPAFDQQDQSRREQPRGNDRRDDGPRADVPRHEGPRQDGPTGDGPRNDGPPGERL